LELTCEKRFELLLSQAKGSIIPTPVYDWGWGWLALLQSHSKSGEHALA
jgi:hypothetical protein